MNSESQNIGARKQNCFFAAFAFFGAIIFLPRWFQIVQNFSPTNSGLAALPLVIGLIGLLLDLLVRRLERFDEVSWGYGQR